MRGMHADLSGVDPRVVNLTHRAVLGDILTRGARTFGERLAIVDGDREISYRELEKLANAVARNLLARGIRRGDGVALQCVNRWEFVVSFFAIAKAGATVLPINLALAASDIAFQLSDSGVKAVITETAYVPVLEKALEGNAGASVEHIHVIGGPETTLAGRRASDYAALVEGDGAPLDEIIEDRDIAYCLYTSGTTALPKGVVTSHVSAVIGAMGSALELGLRRGREGSLIPIGLPLFHVGALNSLLLPLLLTGGIAVLHRSMDAAVILGEFKRRRPTHIMLHPSSWAAILEHPMLAEVDRTSLEVAFYAMAPMTRARLEGLREAFPNANVVLGSGQTETTPISCFQWPEHQGEKDDSWGAPTITSDIAIMGPDGTLCPPGVEGEIVYRMPQLMEGYWNNPDANRVAFAHGWFHGGDIGYRDEEGVLWFTDRTKDMIKSGGENVSSVEVENVLRAHASVLECAVIGVPDDRWGEAVTAFLVLRPGHRVEPEAIREHCRGALAGFKVPKAVRFIDALPKTATGKVQKAKIRQDVDR